MFFNSLSFAFFLPIVFLLYWFVCFKKNSYQNLLLLVASYYFYSFWDYRFLFLLLFSTLLDYFSGIKIGRSTNQKNKKFWLILSIGINLGFLGVFKYYNFFAISFQELLKQVGFEVDILTLNVILPVGISFYTFHGLSYVIDIYYDRIKPETKIVDYSLFVSYFPLLVAGPIERATHLLPQLKVTRKFNYEVAVSGLKQILWGLFKKVVIADQCAVYADDIFNNSMNYSGSSLLLGGIFFAFQIYGDFSGYSDIALGTSKLFGIDLLKNFSYPYFSRNIAEFWRRWHISLSSWFRDYLYIPLGGSKVKTWKKIRNVLIIFLVSGFWHGANWTFIFWGLLNALFILPSILMKTNRVFTNVVAEGRSFPSFRELLSMIITFLLSVITWIFFRSENIADAFDYLKRMIFTVDLFKSSPIAVNDIMPYLTLFILIEWMGRERNFALEKFGIILPRIVRWSFYIFLVYNIYYFSGEEQEFIYFQF